jgi:hypothetical protein
MTRLALALTTLFLAPAAPAAADRFAIEYEGAIYGVLDLGEIYLDLTVDEQTYDVTAKLRSGGLLRLFEPTDLVGQASGAVTDNRLTWSRYDLDHSYSKKRRVTSLRRDENGAVSAQITPTYRLWGDPPASEAQKSESRDPLSSIVAMGVDVANGAGCTGSYPVFDGRHRYDLVLSGGREGQLNRGGFKGRAIKCKLRYVAVAGFNPSEQDSRARVPNGEIWFGLVEGAKVAPMVRALIPTERGRAGISLKRFDRPVITVTPALEPEQQPEPTAPAQPSP